MEEFLYNGELFDIYGALLNESNKKFYKLYYEENLTLQEIADLENVSKSYVGNIIKKTSEKLKEYESVLHVYENIEKKLVPVLADMEKTGILIDPEYFETYGNELKQNLSNIEKEIFQFAGEEFNINSPKQI